MKKNYLLGHFHKRKCRKMLLVMKTVILLTLAFTVSVTASVKSQTQKVNLNVKEGTILSVLNEIKAQTGLRFIYNEDKMEGLGEISVNVKGATVQRVLNDIFKDSKLECRFAEDVILVVDKPRSNEILQENKIKITGTVKDQDGDPIPGVNIILVEGSRGTISDNEGNYQIEIPENSYLKFSFIGFETQIVATENKAVLDVVLISETRDINEVIVTGYQKISVEKSTGSVVTLKAKDFEKKGQSNLINSLEGIIAGLGISNNPGREGEQRINIRGSSTINGNSSPLLIVDGFPVEMDLSQINPYEVESVNVLKDAAAASIYGARSANGVIVITTKAGKKGKASINYTNNFTFSQQPDLDYRMNRMSSSDLVDAQVFAAGDNPHTYEYFWKQAPEKNRRKVYARNLVYDIVAQVNEGTLTQQQADEKLNALRGKDNLSQMEDIFTQNPFEQQHNLSISGGGENNNYRVSLNYTGADGSWVGDGSERFIFNVNNNIKISDKINANIGANLNMYNTVSVPFNKDVLLKQVSSYELFKDNDGNALPVRIGELGPGGTNNKGLYGGKDPIEIQRLIDMGLLDESYYPVNEINKYSKDKKSFSARVQGQINAELLQGLNGQVGFQYETGASKDERLAKADSYEISQIVNNTAPYDYNGNREDLNIPMGGRFTQTRADRQSYTLRAQLDLDKRFGRHNVRALAGSEIREVFNSYTRVNKLGYNPASLLFYKLNDSGLSQGIQNVNHPMGEIYGGVVPYTDDDKFYEKKDRHFSVYGNGSYDYKRKYILSGSVRIDQSNLFGTNSEFRYKPFWSVGAKWRISEEKFFNSNFINGLSLRYSCGINGNIANKYGPFNIAKSMIGFRSGYERSLYIQTPSILDLRWERSTTSNIGLDMSMLERKINLSLDYYVKDTDDILASGKSDPTQGWGYLMRNDANFINKGIEVSLSTTNIQSNNFTWGTILAYRYNDNEVDKVMDKETGVQFVAGRQRNLEGYPSSSYFVYDWVGLDDKGQVQVRRANGEIVTVDKGLNYGGTFSMSESLKREDLIYAGTSEPKYTGALTNNLQYKDFGLSFMFVFSGGHVLINDTYNGEYIGSRPRAIHADAAKAWKQAGDEKTTDVPVINSNTFASGISRYSTKNVIDGDYIKLRELIFTYSIPQRALKKMFMQNAVLSLRANNLFYWAKNDEGIDPESHGIGYRFFPTKPSFSVGLNINF